MFLHILKIWCGDCLDITAYSSGVFILLQTDFTTDQSAYQI